VKSENIIDGKQCMENSAKGLIFLNTGVFRFEATFKTLPIIQMALTNRTRVNVNWQDYGGEQLCSSYFPKISLEGKLC
jgi:hypothetical protein